MPHVVLEKINSAKVAFDSVVPFTAMLAKQIKDANPGVSYGKTNLQDFLLEYGV